MIICPACNNPRGHILQEIKLETIKESNLYKDVKIARCSYCLHYFNVLSKKDITGLKEYYFQEYTENKFNPTRINYNFFDHEPENNDLVIGPNKEIAYTLNILYLNKKNLKAVKKINFIALNQVLEHCWSLNNVIFNLKKLLSPNGLLYVSVPDFDGYKYDLFPYFLTIREHVQHFTENSLISALCGHGFELLEFRRSALPLLNRKLDMMNIEFLFKYHPGEAFPVPLKFSQEVYCYGAGRELTYYLTQNKLFYLYGIFDDNKNLIGKTIKNTFILDPKIISSLHKSSTIVVTSIYSKEKIIERIKSFNFKGKIKTI